MNRVIHFEIQADEPLRAKDFYEKVFGWTFVDYSEYTGTVYWGVLTAPEGSSELGINGGLLKRPTPLITGNCGTNAFVATIGAEDFDLMSQKILTHGGKIALEKFALPGMAWQGYFQDTEGNTFGIHVPDTNAR